MNNNKKCLKKTFLIIWIFIVVVIITLFLINKDFANIVFSYIITNNKILSIILYFLVISITSIFLIPSTPFVIGGLLFFPPIVVFIVGITGILVSVFFVYYFARYVGLDKHLEKKYPKQIIKLRKRLKNKMLLIITIWSITPFVPTDLIVYVASTLKISFKKCLIGVLVGEGLLNLIYIISLSSLLL